jgi:hypothetical protein
MIVTGIVSRRILNPAQSSRIVWLSIGGYGKRSYWLTAFSTLAASRLSPMDNMARLIRLSGLVVFLASCSGSAAGHRRSGSAATFAGYATSPHCDGDHPVTQFLSDASVDDWTFKALTR